MSTVTVAATQMACGWDREANRARAERLIREAARRGARGPTFVGRVWDIGRVPLLPASRNGCAKELMTPFTDAWSGPPRPLHHTSASIVAVGARAPVPPPHLHV